MFEAPLIWSHDIIHENLKMRSHNLSSVHTNEATHSRFLSLPTASGKWPQQVKMQECRGDAIDISNKNFWKVSLDFQVGIPPPPKSWAQGSDSDDAYRNLNPSFSLHQALDACGLGWEFFTNGDIFHSKCTYDLLDNARSGELSKAALHYVGLR